MSSVSASILLPVSIADVYRVITDPNTIFRLSPFFTLKHIERPKSRAAQQGDRYSLTIEYYGNKITETFGVTIERFEMDDLVSYTMENSVVKNIRYELEPAGTGVQLTKTLDLDSENDVLIKGTQGELQIWLNSIGKYLKICEGKSPIKRAWKWFIDRVWLRLTLSERNVAIIMIKISVLEIALLLVLVLIWNIGIWR